MEEYDILEQYNLPQKAEKYYCQIDALSVYNIQNKMDILYTQNPAAAELDYTQPRGWQHLRDAVADFAFPGLKNILNDDGLFLFVSNFTGSTMLRSRGGIGHIMLLPRPGIGSEAYATNLCEVLEASLMQYESVVLGGKLIELIKKDLDMKKKEKEFIGRMIKSEEFIQTGKYNREFQVQFGGSRGNGDGGWIPSAALKAAANQLTWIIRNTTVIADAVKNGDGSVTITYSLHPDEKLDLRPNGSESAYDRITAVLGHVYHDLCRGYDQMRVKATWSTTIQL